MTEKKDPSFKLVTTAKEFVPKEKKSIDKEPASTGQKTAPATTTAQAGSLNPAAKEFVPKMSSPEMYPAVPPVVFVPAFIPAEQLPPAQKEEDKNPEGMRENHI